MSSQKKRMLQSRSKMGISFGEQRRMRKPRRKKKKRSKQRKARRKRRMEKNPLMKRSKC